MSGTTGAAALLARVDITLASVGLDAARFGDIVAEIVSADSGSETIAAVYDAMFASTEKVLQMFAGTDIDMTLLKFTSEQAQDFLTSVAAASNAKTEVFSDMISEAAIQVILDRADVGVDLSVFAGCGSCASAEALHAALSKVIAVAPSAAESTNAAIRALFLGIDGASLSLASMDAAVIDIFKEADVTAIALCHGRAVHVETH
jgi:hypothetical protein